MTKKLHELLELPDSDISDEIKLTDPLPNIPADYSESTLSNLEKIEAALPMVKGLETADSELDELAELATNTFKDLVDLGQQVESRFSSEIFSAAGTMLGHAITAKTAKINKKLRMIDQQLKKAQLDAKLATKQEEVESTPVGEGKALDRNELLKLYTDRDKK